MSVYPSPSLSPYQDVAPSLGVVREEIRTRVIDLLASLDELHRSLKAAPALATHLSAQLDLLDKWAALASQPDIAAGAPTEKEASNGS